MSYNNFYSLLFFSLSAIMRVFYTMKLCVYLNKREVKKSKLFKYTMYKGVKKVFGWFYLCAAVDRRYTL